ncbi:MAG TPA: MarR family transcriptional regulator, partial [Longimicrobium sp.]|nr:MarR family transcriptional regulator [Longimicrobium sp.]
MQIGRRHRSSLETPLNWILASEGSVRILRELALAGGPLTKAEIARRSGISLPGVVKALPRLLASGVVASVGTGGRPLVTIRGA